MNATPAAEKAHAGITLDRGSTRHQADDEIGVFGFWTFMMSDVIIFVLLFATYGVLVRNTAHGPDASSIFSLPMTAVETALLLTSSLTFGLASANLKAKRQDRVVLWLAVTFAFGALFLGFEIHEFAGAFAKGATPQVSGFLSGWFTLVATHSLHVAIGLGWIGLMLVQLFVLGSTADVERRLLRLGIFWHLLDIIWIGIFSFVYLGGLA